MATIFDAACLASRPDQYLCLQWVLGAQHMRPARGDFRLSLDLLADGSPSVLFAPLFAASIIQGVAGETVSLDRFFGDPGARGG